MPLTRLLACTLLFTPLLAWSAEAPPRSADEILKSLKLPAGYTAQVLVKAPELGYPTAVSAAADGTVFVAVDLNGSLDRTAGHGRVVRVRDTDGDGHADELKTFAEMDSPRGVIWDGPTGTSPGTLYVMHPPNLTAYRDTDGDGVADKQEELITGLGFGLDFRGADHTTNGCRLGMDGYIYVAVGDYGYVAARGKDGTTINNRGGGIVRVRTDGTGLEIVSRGQRNIYDVAVSPTLDLFTRDNTNDGGAWNVRLSYVPAGAQMGYPRLFLNFPEDMLQPLADYGGGSPCGALWLDEPGLPRGLFTVEWGVSGLMYHPLKAKGAGFEAQQEKWLGITRPTDMDVDASGALYVTSWEGATFNYNGPHAGYVVTVRKAGYQAPPWSDPSKLGEDALVVMLGADSAVRRQAAQRELLRRHAVSTTMPLTGMVANAATPEGKVAALETLKLLEGSIVVPMLPGLPGGPTANLLRVLGEFPQANAQVQTILLTSGLEHQDPAVRREAITAIRRLGRQDLAPRLLPFVADTDPVLAHLAGRALSELNAKDVCLAALDGADAAVQPGALRALYGMADEAVVDGLLARLPKSQGELRHGILNALCRLSAQDEPYTDPKVWWGTRPDTSGPLYKPAAWAATPRIEAALQEVVHTAPAEEVSWLAQRMYQTKTPYPGLVELMLQRAGNDTKAKLTAMEGLLQPNGYLPPEACTVLKEVAAEAQQTPEARAQALRLLQRGSSHTAVFPFAVAAFAPLAGEEIASPVLAGAYEDFTRDPKHGLKAGEWTKEAYGKDAATQRLGKVVLVNLATSKLVGKYQREQAAQAVERAWAKPETAAAMLAVVAQTGARSYAEQVKSMLNHPNNAVAEAALFAYQKLGLNQAATEQPIGELKFEEVAKKVKSGGDMILGKGIFLRAGCIACHTTSPDEPPKGPVLSAVAKIYDRPTLTESILKPNARLAQGFESQWFRTSKGDQVEGFVTREGGDSLDVRNVVGQTVTLEKGDIAERGKRDISMMPEGLMNGFTPTELSALLAYLESLKGN